MKTPKKAAKVSKGRLSAHHARKVAKKLNELHPKFAQALHDAGFKNLRVVSFTLAKRVEGEDLNAAATTSTGSCHVNEDGTITC
jgi:hypothetical protein